MEDGGGTGGGIATGASGFLLGVKNEDDKLTKEVKVLLKSPRSNDPTPPTDEPVWVVSVTLEGEDFVGDGVTLVAGDVILEDATGEEEGCCCCEGV